MTKIQTIWANTKPLVLAVLFGIGIAGILLSYNLARNEVSLYNVSVLFWLSYFAMTLPFIVVILAPDSKFWSRIGSLIGFALGTSLPKIFRSLEGPIYSDEYGHLSAVQDILENGSIGWWNSIVAPVPDYSVMHYFASFIVETAGLEIWTAANILIIIFHVLTLLGIFALLRIKFSPRAAAVGALIYAANPNWMFFHSRFAYETSAIMLMFWLLFFVIRGLEAPAGQRSLMLVIAGPLMFVLSRTHHIAFLAAAALIIIYILILIAKEYKVDILKAWTAGATFIWLFIWALPNILAYGSLILEYVQYTFEKPTRSNIPFLLELIASDTEEGTEDLTLTYNTYASLPLYEQIAGLLVPIIFAGIFIFFWYSEIKKHGNLPAAFKNQTTFSLYGNVLSILYFLVLPLIFIEEYTVVRRSWTYLLLGFAILFAIFYERYLLSVPKSQRGRPPKWKQLNALIIVSFVMVSISSLANGATAAQRYPIGESTLGFSSSVNLNPELSNLALWAKNTLPKESWIMTDRYTRNPLVYPGGFNIAPIDPERFPYWEIFLNPSDPPAQVMESAKTLGVDYIVFNRYTFNAPTSYGYWFHPDEKLSYSSSEFGLYGTTLVEAFRLSKWVETVWASENYVVYKILWSQYEPRMEEAE